MIQNEIYKLYYNQRFSAFENTDMHSEYFIAKKAIKFLEKGTTPLGTNQLI